MGPFDKMSPVLERFTEAVKWHILCNRQWPANRKSIAPNAICRWESKPFDIGKALWKSLSCVECDFKSQ